MPTGPRQIAAFLAAMGVSVVAPAQDIRADQMQIGGTDEGSLAVQQLSEPGQRILRPPAVARPTVPIAQVSVSGTPRQPMSQVTS